ncbi:MAG: tetraacyldisaccharide 4'-kinase [Syntrophorhabdales bacterium]
MIRIWKGEAPRLRAFLFPLLFALSYAYKAGLAARDLCYTVGIARVARPSVPVISVGNLSLGGTGKTTVVERLSRELKKRGFCPGIVMLGYKKKRRGAFAVDCNTDTAESAGDEAIMLARRTMLPVLVGKKRSESIERGIRDFGIDVAIFDDGFQVRNVHKDVELLILDGRARGPALHLFPLGFLREPLEMVKKADILLVNRGEMDGRAGALTAGIPVFHVRYRPLHLCRLKDRAMVDYGHIRGKKVLAFSGLGDNSSFFRLLQEIGADVVRTVEFPDHYRYHREDLRRIESLQGVEMVITTEKDAVKIDGTGVRDNLFSLLIEAEIENEDALLEQVCGTMRG